MVDLLGNAVPGRPPVLATDNGPFTSGRGLAELSSSFNQATYVTYNEVIFHDDQEQVDWFGQGDNPLQTTVGSWRYGWAIDSTLGYP